MAKLMRRLKRKTRHLGMSAACKPEELVESFLEMKKVPAECADLDLDFAIKAFMDEAERRDSMEDKFTEDQKARYHATVNRQYKRMSERRFTPTELEDEFDKYSDDMLKADAAAYFVKYGMPVGAVGIKRLESYADADEEDAAQAGKKSSSEAAPAKKEAKKAEKAAETSSCEGFADHFRKTGSLPKSCRSVLDLADVTRGFAPSWASSLTEEQYGDVVVAIKKETERLLGGKVAGTSPRQKNPYRAKAALAVWNDCELARKEAGVGVAAPTPEPIVEDKPAKAAKPKKERAKKAEKAAAPAPAPELPAITPKAVETLPVKKTELVVGPGRNRQGAEIVGRFTVNDRAYACHLKRVRVNQYTTEKRPKVFCFADMTATPKKKAATTAA